MVDMDKILNDTELWDKAAKEADERKEKLQSFGENAFGIFVKTEDGMFVVDPEDACVSQDLLNKGSYNTKELETARSFTTKDSDILVVGAHLGTHAIALSKTCKHVIAIEANTHTYTLLEANVLLNKRTNIELHNIAAAESSRKIEFMMSRANSGGSKRGPLKESKPAYIYDKPEVVEIDAVPLDAYLEDKAYDLVLMDIEGSEYFALQGMQKILANTKALSVEYLPHLLKYGAGISPQQFADLLTPHFDWLYVPENDHTISPKEAIPNMLQGMYDADCGFENLYFLKDPLPQRLMPR